MSDLVPVLKFVRLPDGRWAMENGQGVESVSRADIREMNNVWRLWAELRWERADPKVYRHIDADTTEPRADFPS